MKIRDFEHFDLPLYHVRDQLKQHVYDRSITAFDENDKGRDSIVNQQDFEKRQALIRKQLIEAIGGLPSNNTPLNPQIKDTVKCRGFRIEKVIYESCPNLYVTANLYIPDGITSPRGAVLFLCGHAEYGKHYQGYQMACQYLVHAGLVVLAIDPIGQGERLSYYEKSLEAATVDPCMREHDYVGGQCLPLGESLAKYFVHDSIRGVDYLCSRQEVDPKKIGVTGGSGGGTQTSLMMICDKRIAAAAPATFIMSRRTFMYANDIQDAEQIWPGMSALGFDHEDILMSMVPRPVRVLAAQYDFFPIEGTRSTVERTKRFWDMYGKADNIDLVEDQSTHRYTESLAIAAAEFFSKHLLGEKCSPVSCEIQTLTPSFLWCTTTGQVRGDYEQSRAVHEEIVDRLMELKKRRQAVPDNERKEKALSWLRNRVMFSRKPCVFNPRHVPIGLWDDLMVQSTIWWSQKGMFNHAFLVRSYKYQHLDLPLTIAVWDGGTGNIKAHVEWINNTCHHGRAVMILDVSGVGALTPSSLNDQDDLDFEGVVHKLTTDLIWLNDSMAALRTYDVLRAIDFASDLPGINEMDIRLYADGRQGLYAVLAETLDEKVEKIDTVNGMESVEDWVKARHYNSYDIMSVVLPGMLHYFDLPDLIQFKTIG